MRLSHVILAGTAFVGGCASLTVGDARAYGRIHDVTIADIQAAIDADRVHTREKIYEIEVVSSDEIRLYYERRADAKASYDIIRRVGGKWRSIVSPVIVG